MSSGLAWIGQITRIAPISGADRIDQAEVVLGKGGKWSGVVVKGQFKEGDQAQVYLQDSLLPATPEFDFLKDKKYRIRMVRLRGIPSECLIMTQTIPGNVGDDVTELAGVTKYEKPLPASLGGEVYGHFPQFIPRTDEPNFQQVPDMVNALRGQSWYATVKCDGTSTTCYRWQGHFGVCSRNYEWKDIPQNIMWQVAKKYGLPANLPEGFALQWETVGPVQGNPMGLSAPDMRLFDVYDIAERKYLDIADTVRMVDRLYLRLVDTIPTTGKFNMDDEQIRRFAEVMYSNGHLGEGVVIRPMKEQIVEIDGEKRRLSFKSVSLLYRD